MKTGLDKSRFTRLKFHSIALTVNSMTELCGCSAHRHVTLSTDEFKLKYGNIVTKEHKVALNQPIKVLNRDPNNTDIIGPTFRHSTALSKSERVIKRPKILSDLTRQGTEHLQSQSMKAPSSAAHYSFCSNTTVRSEKGKTAHSQKEKGGNHKYVRPTRTYHRLCFSRMHTSLNNRGEGLQPDEDDRAPSQAPRLSKRLRLASGQPQRHCIRQEQNKSKTLSKQLYPSRAR